MSQIAARRKRYTDNYLPVFGQAIEAEPLQERPIHSGERLLTNLFDGAGPLGGSTAMRSGRCLRRKYLAGLEGTVWRRPRARARVYPVS